MSWWVLLLLWLLLLLLAIGLVALVALRVFRRFRALVGEIGAAAERLADVAEGRTGEGRTPGPDARGTTTGRGRSST